MHIICMTPLEEGVYNDHKADHITVPPAGWAYIPEDFPLPVTFPRLGSLKAEEQAYGEDGGTVLTVTAMTVGTLPEFEETEEGKTMEQRVTALEESGAEMAEALYLLLSGVTE